MQPCDVTTLAAHAKLTLSLRVTGVRPDGYHLLAAEMCSVELADELTFGEGDRLTLSGIAVDGDPADNLVVRALRAVDRTADVHVLKRIPPGGGLGGGSADAAAVLRWAGCDDLDLAASLGADVPFCLVGGRAMVSGIGEVVEPLPFHEASFTLLTPALHVPTPAVYRAWDDLGGPVGDNDNDLEPAALAVEPRLADARDALAEASGQRPRLAGSGATWFVPGEFPGPGRLVVRAVPAPTQP